MLWVVAWEDVEHRTGVNWVLPKTNTVFRTTVSIAPWPPLLFNTHLAPVSRAFENWLGIRTGSETRPDRVYKYLHVVLVPVLVHWRVVAGSGMSFRHPLRTTANW